MTDNNVQNFFSPGASLLDEDIETPKGPVSPEKTQIPETPKATAPKQQVAKSSSATNAIQAKKDADVARAATEAIEILNKAKLTAQAEEVKTIIAESKSQKFTVAVVGEFSRGKSTFVNKLLGKDILPVANMPTTAILTRIRHSEKEGITIIDANNKSKKALPLSLDSWKNYVADDDGNDPNGVAFVNINSPWLKKGVEIVDTPGAGDLEISRARLIGDALKASDAAVITISALSALSMSEKLFIEERLISKKTPFLMLIITKLDQVDVKQRNAIIDYVKEKLNMWKFNSIDVFIPYNMDMPDDKYKGIMGMDKIVNRINSWMVSSDRKKLTTQWTALKLKSHLTSVIDYAKERRCLTDEVDESKRSEMLEKKAEMIEKADKVWDEAKIAMIKKGDDCYKLFVGKINDYKSSLIEKMQYEISHISNPQKWWSEDFPYKLKIEMTNLSNTVEAIVSRSYTKDTSWFNMVLERNFKTSVLVESDEIADRDHYTSFSVDGDIQLSDLSKERNMSRIGITALSIGAVMGCMAIGIAPIFATMGLGTGGSLLSEGIFKKKTESQKQILKDEVAKRVPVIVDNATSHSESRIKAMYLNVIKEATKQQEKWMESQKSVIASATDDKSGATFNATALIGDLKAICNKIDEEFPC